MIHIMCHPAQLCKNPVWHAIAGNTKEPVAQPALCGYHPGGVGWRFHGKQVTCKKCLKKMKEMPGRVT